MTKRKMKAKLHKIKSIAAMVAGVATAAVITINIVQKVKRGEWDLTGLTD